MNKKMPISNIINWFFVVMFGVIVFPLLRISHIGTVVMCFFTMLLGSRYVSKKYIWTLLIMLFFAIYCLSIVNTIGWENINFVYAILAGLIIFMVFRNAKLTKNQMLCMAGVLAISYFYWISNSSIWVISYITRKLDINPNIVAAYLLYITIILYIIFAEIHRKYAKVLRYAIILIGAWGIFQLQARASLIGLISFLILNFMLTKEKVDKNMLMRVGFVVSIILEIAVPFIYVFLFKNGIGNNINILNVSKNFYTGREVLWAHAFECLDSFGDWMIGTGESIDESMGLGMHNNAVHLLVTHGVIGLVWFYVMLYEMIFKNLDVCSFHLWQNRMLLLFISSLVVGIIEMNLSADMGFYTFLPLGIACNPYYKREKLVMKE